MASESQYEFFKCAYDEERDRYRELINRGKVFLTVVSIYLGLLAANADRLSKGYRRIRPGTANRRRLSRRPPHRLRRRNPTQSIGK